MSIEAKIFIRNEGPIEKLVRNKYAWIIFLLLLYAYPFVRSLNRELPPELPRLHKIPEFSFTNQLGNEISSKGLKGSAYVASFFFTSCPSVCPEHLKNIKKLQKRIRGLREKAQILSFSIDPEVDTTKVLLKKAKEVGANPLMWHMLTGDKAKIDKLLISGFKVPVGEKTAETVYDIAHSTKVVLVDLDGYVRGYYELDEKSMDRLVIDIGLLANLGTTYQKVSLNHQGAY